MKPKRCPHCGASMATYTFRFDILDALLLLEMAAEVKKRLAQGAIFTVANQIHVPSIEGSHAIKCRTTQCSKLGLIAKVKNFENHHVGGTWCITKRGFDALKGLPVPAEVKCYRGVIEERPTKVTTLAEAQKINAHLAFQAKVRRKTPLQDARLVSWNPIEWVTFGE